MHLPDRCVRRPVWSGEDVRDHGEEAEVEDPKQKQADEPHLVLDLPGIHEGSDPGDDAGDQTTRDRDDPDEPSATEDQTSGLPRSPTMSEPSRMKVPFAIAIVTATMPRIAPPMIGDAGADEEPCDCCLGHDVSLPFSGR